MNINGSKAYRLAREGQDFELKSKKVTVSRFEIVRRDGNNYTFDIVCSGGTYIRSLCRDLAAALGAKAYMSMLIRLGSGIFDIGQSVPVEALEKDFDKYLLPITYPLKGIERFDSEPKNYRRLLNGNEVFVKSADKKQALIYCNNEFFGIGAVKNNILKVNVNLKYD